RTDRSTTATRLSHPIEGAVRQRPNFLGTSEGYPASRGTAPAGFSRTTIARAIGRLFHAPAKVFPGRSPTRAAAHDHPDAGDGNGSDRLSWESRRRSFSAEDDGGSGS